MQFLGELERVYTGAAGGSTSRWVAADDINRVLLVTPSVQPLFWEQGLVEIPEFGKCRPIPGLSDSGGWDGVESFAGHTLLWRGTTLKWSDLGDFANWIPVAITAAAGQATVADSYIQPATGSTSAVVILDAISGSFVRDQYVRVVSNDSNPSERAYSYYSVSEVSSAAASVDSIAAEQSVPAGDDVTLYTSEYLPVVSDGRIKINGDTTPLVIVEGSRELDQTYTLGGASSVVGAVGTTVSFPLSAFPFALKLGDVISVGTSDRSGQDLYAVTVIGQTLIARRLGAGAYQKPVGQSYAYGGANPVVYVRFQHWVSVTNPSTSGVVVQGESVLATADSLKLISLGYTGGIKQGSVVPSGSVVETLNANEAGEVENVGNGVNGDIFTVTKLADYSYILKQKSIQSVQYVGRTNGVFFIRGEIYDEGLIGRYAWCRMGESAIIFWGSKGWFKYIGGQQLEALGASHFDTAHSELDVSRADEIVAYHNKADSEVWFIYPVLGSRDFKAVVLNYDFGTVAVDRYPGELNGISAVGTVDWELAPTWDSLPLTEKYSDSGKRWFEYSDIGQKPYPVIGITGDLGNTEYGESSTELVPRLLLSGRSASRTSRDDCDPQPRISYVETVDHDFGDAAVVKYVDTVRVGLFVPDRLAHPLKLRVHLGCRMSEDSDVVWSGPETLEVSGHGNFPASVNLRGAGRLVRLKFESVDVDVEWGVTGYEIIGRFGTTY